MKQRFETFEEFWPFYVGQHSRLWTRRLHFIGSAGGAVLLGAALFLRRPALAAAAPFFAYGLAWYSHFVIEKNRPATFSHPLWSLRGDLRMFVRMIAGRMEDEVARAAAAV